LGHVGQQREVGPGWGSEHHEVRTSYGLIECRRYIRDGPGLGGSDRMGSVTGVSNDALDTISRGATGNRTTNRSEPDNAKCVRSQRSVLLFCRPDEDLVHIDTLRLGNGVHDRVGDVLGLEHDLLTPTLRERDD
jgi:hypothetical protein